MHTSGMQANLDLPKENKDAFSDIINMRIVCSRVKGADSHNIFINIFLTRYSVSTSHYSSWKFEVMFKNHKLSENLTNSSCVTPQINWEVPVQAHQLATAHLRLNEGPRQANDFSRKAYLHVKISVLIHTRLQSLLRDYPRSLADNYVFSRLGFVQASALLFLFQGCKDMRHRRGIWHYSSLRELRASCWGTDLLRQGLCWTPRPALC